MKILVTGAYGYMGRVIIHEFARDGHEMMGVDNYVREQIEYLDTYDHQVKDKIIDCDCTDIESMRGIVNQFQPDTIIHLGEQRSAPYSMLGAPNGLSTINGNVSSTMVVCVLAEEVGASIIHIGSMGMYGYGHRGDVIEDGNLSKRAPTSIYHLSKEMDNSLLRYYGDNHGLVVNEMVQGTVWGIGGRFDYDSVYGTVINRFILQRELGMQCTVYGKGTQKRSFIHIDDSIECIRNVLGKGTGYNQYNQYTQVLDINEIADVIGNPNGTCHTENIRSEDPDNTFNVHNDRIMSLGITPTLLCGEEVDKIASSLKPHLSDVNINLINGLEKWK